jgi:DNA invertase Pin-like site-specific DNA recombinase
LNEVNKAVINREIQYLLVNDISRLGRVMSEIVGYVDWLKANGVELICADGVYYEDSISTVLRDCMEAGTARLMARKKTQKI